MWPNFQGRQQLCTTSSTTTLVLAGYGSSRLGLELRLLRRFLLSLCRARRRGLLLRMQRRARRDVRERHAVLRLVVAVELVYRGQHR